MSKNASFTLDDIRREYLPPAGDPSRVERPRETGRRLAADILRGVTEDAHRATASNEKT
jgi:hypothetical protein